MTKIAFIGAGSIGFTRGLVRDILTFPLLKSGRGSAVSRRISIEEFTYFLITIPFLGCHRFDFCFNFQTRCLNSRAQIVSYHPKYLRKSPVLKGTAKLSAPLTQRDSRKVTPKETRRETRRLAPSRYSATTPRQKKEREPSSVLCGLYGILTRPSHSSTSPERGSVRVAMARG